jgi:hypothetical protein
MSTSAGGSSKNIIEMTYSSLTKRLKINTNKVISILFPSPPTIGTHGCALCCAAMILDAHGVQKIDPHVLNNWLADPQHIEEGYDDDYGINWKMIADYPCDRSEKLQWDSNIKRSLYNIDPTKTDPKKLLTLKESILKTLKEQIDQGNPVILRLKRTDRTDINSFHYVVVKGYKITDTSKDDPESTLKKSDFIVCDPSPLSGEPNLDNDKYEDIYGWRIFYNVGAQKDDSKTGEKSLKMKLFEQCKDDWKKYLLGIKEK